MPFFVFSNDFTAISYRKGGFLNKEITIASVGNEHIEMLLSEERGLFYTLLDVLKELAKNSIS